MTATVTAAWTCLYFRRGQNEREAGSLLLNMAFFWMLFLFLVFFKSFSRRQTLREPFFLMQCNYCLQRKKKKAGCVHRHYRFMMGGPIVGQLLLGVTKKEGKHRSQRNFSVQAERGGEEEDDDLPSQHFYCLSSDDFRFYITVEMVLNFCAGALIDVTHNFITG